MSESAPGGFKQMEAITRQLQANAPTAEELNARAAKNLAIEARSISPEVSALNDAAEIAIYGVHGHAGERHAKSAEYQSDVQELLEEGFQLTQAKLIMDRRERVEADNKKKQKEKVDAAADDTAFKSFIRDNGIFSKEELAPKPSATPVGPAKAGILSEELKTAITASIKNKAKPEVKANDDDPEVKNIYFSPDKNGDVQTGAEVTQEGDGVDLNSLHGGEALLYTENTTFYVNGKDIDDLMLHAKFQREGDDSEGLTYEFEEVEEFPFAIVGQPLMVDDEPVSGPIKKIQVKMEQVNQDELEAGVKWGARGDDPFVIARELLNKTDALEEDEDLEQAA